MVVRIVRKNESDTNDKLISKFKKSIREARYVQKMRKSKYHTKKLTGQKQKERALVREGHRADNKRKELTTV